MSSARLEGRMRCILAHQNRYLTRTAAPSGAAATRVAVGVGGVTSYESLKGRLRRCAKSLIKSGYMTTGNATKLRRCAMHPGGAIE